MDDVSETSKTVYNIYDHQGDLVESIDMKQQTPITRADCQHELIRDDSETDFIAYSCKHCPLGWLVDKQ